MGRENSAWGNFDGKNGTQLGPMMRDTWDSTGVVDLLPAGYGGYD